MKPPRLIALVSEKGRNSANQRFGTFYKTRFFSCRGRESIILFCVCCARDCCFSGCVAARGAAPVCQLRCQTTPQGLCALTAVASDSMIQTPAPRARLDEKRSLNQRCAMLFFSFTSYLLPSTSASAVRLPANRRRSLRRESSWDGISIRSSPFPRRKSPCR